MLPGNPHVPGESGAETQAAGGCPLDVIMYSTFGDHYVCYVWISLCTLRLDIIMYATFGYHYVRYVWISLCTLRLDIIMYATFGYDYVCYVWISLCMLRLDMIMYATFHAPCLCSLAVRWFVCSMVRSAVSAGIRDFEIGSVSWYT